MSKFILMLIVGISLVRAEELTLMDEAWKGAIQQDDKYTKDDHPAMKWNAGKNPLSTMELRGKYFTKNDWSKFKILHFWGYLESETAAPLVIQICPFSEVEDNDGQRGYYCYKFNADWTGWKEFNIPFMELRKYGATKNWDTEWKNVFRFAFIGHFSQAPTPGTYLYVSDMKLLSE
ncbi:MAG: carbohydrate binding domain-containing protein [Verrucomicrobiota bacterium]